MSSAQTPRRLQTDRLDLRPLTLHDLAGLHPIISDPGNCVHIPEGPKDNLETSRAWIERFSVRWSAVGLGYWTVRLRDSGTVIGAGGAARRPRFWSSTTSLTGATGGCGY